MIQKKGNATRKDFYETKLEEHGAGSMKSVGWDNTEKAIQRYVLVGNEIQELGVTSLLDYGCGLCHLRDWLPFRPQYHGYDINKEAVKAVRQHKPEIYITDWLGEWPFEAVAAIGTFSYREEGETEDTFIENFISNLNYIKNKIKPKYMVMTVLWADSCDYYDPKLFYFRGRHLSLMEEEVGINFLKVKSILGHENMLIFKF
jgi:hypothetical protein